MSKIKEEIFIISIYIENFFFILNSFKILTWLKNFIVKKYNIKDLIKVKTIIKY